MEIDLDINILLESKQFKIGGDHHGWPQTRAKL